MMAEGAKPEQKPNEETSNLVQEPEANYEITKQSFDELWMEYVVSIQESSPSLYATLTKNKPILRDNIIDITIDNKVQETEIKQKRGDILDFLRSKTGNASLQIETQVIASEIASDIAYTDSDKFKKMAEKNPEIIKLKDDLSLEIEF